MTLQEIQAALRASRAKRDKLLDEIAALGEGAGAAERRANLGRGVQRLDQEISQLELQERQGREARVLAGVATADRDNAIFDTRRRVRLPGPASAGRSRRTCRRRCAPSSAIPTC